MKNSKESNVVDDSILFFKDVLGKSLKDKDFCFKIIQSRLKSEHFPRAYMRWVFKELKIYINNPKYGGKLPELKIFKHKLEKDAELDKSLKVPYYEKIKELFSRNIQNEEYSLEVIEDRIRYKEFKFLLEDTIGKMGRFKDPNIAINNLINKSFRISSQNMYNSVDLFEHYGDRLKEREEFAKNPKKYKILKFNIKAIDECLPGGLRAPRVGSIAAKTGRGKSILAMFCGVQGFLQGLNVTHIISEDEIDEVTGRYDSNISGFKYDDIQLDKLDKKSKIILKNKIINYKKNFKNRIKIIKFKPNEFTASSILHSLNALEGEGHITDLLIIDSPDLMQSVSNHKDKRLQQAAIYWEVRVLCEDKKCIGLVTTQLTRNSSDDNPLAEDLSEAYDKARLLNLLIILSQNKTQKANNEAYLALAKNRGGKTPRALTRVATLFEKMTIEELPPEEDSLEDVSVKKKGKPQLKVIKGGKSDEQLDKLRNLGKSKEKSKLKGVRPVKLIKKKKIKEKTEK